MLELWQIISDFAGKWWWVILIALAFTVLVFIVVVKLQNGRIRKLKKQLKMTNLELETSRTRVLELAVGSETTNAVQTPVETPVAQKPATENNTQSTVAAAQEPAQAAYGATVDESDAYGPITESVELKEPAQKYKPVEQPVAATTVIAPIVAAPKKEEKAESNANTQPQAKNLVLDTVQMDDSFYSDAEITVERNIVTDELNADEYTNSVQLAPSNGTVKYTVMYDRPKDSWVIKKDGVERVIRRVNTKEEALQIARDLCKKYNANLVVHKKDGRFQKQ